MATLSVTITTAQITRIKAAFGSPSQPATAGAVENAVLAFLKDRVRSHEAHEAMEIVTANVDGEIW